MDTLRFYIGGAWVEPEGRETIDVLNPTSEAVLAAVPQGTANDADRAVAAAKAAFPAWSAKTPAERAEVVERIGAAIRAKASELAETISSEVGMQLKLSKIVQVGSPAASWQHYAQLGREFAYEEEIGHSLVVREPIGVVACITPWNFPLTQITHKVAPALAAGCTVVLKPSELAPLNAFALAQIIHEAGAPPGVFNLITGYGPIVGEALASHPDVDMVSFTGSTRAGKRVAALAAETVKRVALELGGKSSSIVLDDADLAAAVKGTLGSCFLNSGQTCLAHTRLLVPESRYEEAKEIARKLAANFIVGDPFAETTKLGPLVSATQREKVRDYIRKGLKEGAELVAGGADVPAGCDTGYFVQPTVLGRVKPTDTLAQEEIFGPVLVIITYRDEAEAVRIANGTIYGLGGAVWSGDLERAMRVARQMRTGQVDVNGGAFNLHAPFGGYKQSGNGREYGAHGFAEFLETKAIQRKVAA
jgi:acyl-CoA reductase-like NAD-dependent aldehyde dehydrogenase